MFKLYIHLSAEFPTTTYYSVLFTFFFETEDKVIGTSDYKLRARVYIYHIMYTITHFSCRPAGSVNRINRIDYRKRPLQCLHRRTPLHNI